MLSHRKVTNIESEVEKAQCLMKSTETTKTMFVVGCRQEITLDITSSPTSSGCSTKEEKAFSRDSWLSTDAIR